MRAEINTLLIIFALLSIVSFSAFSVETCDDKTNTFPMSWDGSIYGDLPTYCWSGYNVYKLLDAAVCFPDDGTCTGYFYKTCQECPDNSSGFIPGGSPVQKPDEDLDQTLDGFRQPSFMMVDTGQINVQWQYNFSKIYSTIKNNYEKTEQIGSNLNSISHDSFLSRQYSHDASLKASDTLKAINSFTDQLEFLEDLSYLSTDEYKNKDTEIYDKTMHTNYMVSDQYSIMNRIDGAVRDNYSALSTQATSHYNSLVNNVGSLNYPIYDIKDGVSKLSSDFKTLSSDVNALSDSIGSGLADLNTGVSSLNEGMGTLNTGVTSLNTGLDTIIGQFDSLLENGLGDVDLSGVKDGLDGIQDSLNGEGMIARGFDGKVDFSGNGLYQSETLESLRTEITDLEAKYKDASGKFSQLFTFDLSDLNQGDYRDHILSFNVGGRQFSMKSGVFPAFLDNANLIAAVLMFIAVLLGIRFLTN